MSIKHGRRRIGWYTDWRGKRRPITIPTVEITLPPIDVDRSRLEETIKEVEFEKSIKTINEFLNKDYFTKQEIGRLPALESIIIELLHPKLKEIVERWNPNQRS